MFTYVGSRINLNFGKFCRELGIGIVPYSPLGKGFFTGIKLAELSDGDYRKVCH